MSDTTTPRLMAAAKEFNIGKDTLVDFLVSKGFNRDDLKPTAKLTEEMYRSLQAGFQGDKVAKQKSNLIDLPKGLDVKKKKEEEEIVFKKEEKKPAKKADEPVVEEKPQPQPQPEPKPEPEPVQEVKPVAEPEPVKIEAPEIEGPKIIDKIDLSQIESSVKPKKPAAKKPEEKKPVEKEPEVKEEKVAEVKAKEETPVAPKVEEKKPEPVVEKEPVVPDAPIIENIRAEKIEGPKILGKIELPVHTDTRPKNDEKRKRKRIPIEKKGGSDNRQGQGQGQGQQGGGTGHQQRQGQGQQQGGGNRFRGNDRRGGGRFNKPEDKEINEKEIQEKIKETQAKLAGAGGRGKSMKAKYRRARREEQAGIGDGDITDNKLQVTEFISVSELASLMDVNFAEVIGKCMNLGIMVSINQRLDAEVIELVAAEFGYEVEFIDLEKQMELEDMEDEEGDENNVPRPPIVTIMGHVDHGKTSLLDYIRNANVVAGEAGGITQHIGAYEVTLANGRQIAFLDTPGHEAFTAMRARGAKVTDIAVIVVSADDAVMPQTKEAISHAQAAGVPMIFAVNKIDKDGANPQKIYEQLAGMNILVEAWGGKFQNQEISAKHGLNVDVLLEKILLEADLLDLKANPERYASGTIIEATLDKGRGNVATMLVQNGTLHQGDMVVSGQHFGKIKAMYNERNQRIDEAPPATPVLVLGLNGAPQAGEKFRVYEDESEAKEVATKRAQLLREQGLRTRKHITLDEIGRRLALGNFKELNIIIKGDVDGSVEALSDSLQKQSTDEIVVRVIHKAVGQISESDVTLAAASDAIIIAFNVRPSLQASKLAENEGVQIKMYSVIYNAIEEIKSAMEGLLEPKIQEKIVCNVEIREVYKFDKATVAGCYVLDGKLNRNSKIRVIRDGIVVYPTGEGASAELGSLKRFKDDAKEVTSNMECGLTIKNYNDIKVGDIVEAFEEEEVRRTL
ncbi:MAG: translation initiation factor IF-2 [Dinghuibacter sp.]|nr:translation initiation factor IF-2 [Dinghuibacter sp.]